MFTSKQLIKTPLYTHKSEGLGSRQAKCNFVYIYIYYIYIYMYINDVVDVMLTPLIHTYVYAENTYFPIFSYIYKV